MNGHFSPQMMVAKPKEGNTFLRGNLGLGFGIFLNIIYQYKFDIIINLILILFHCSLYYYLYSII